MKKKRTFLRLFRYGSIATVVMLFVIQLVPVKRTNPQIESEPIWDAHATRELAARACFDCHSNETKWPWYSLVAPVSWLVAYDVHEGREEFNFSEWGRDLEDEPGELAEEIEETIRNGSMPPWNYVMANPQERRLTSEEQEILIKGLIATVLETGIIPLDYSTLETLAKKAGEHHRKHSRSKHREDHDDDHDKLDDH